MLSSLLLIASLALSVAAAPAPSNVPVGGAKRYIVRFNDASSTPSASTLQSLVRSVNERLDLEDGSGSARANRIAYTYDPTIYPGVAGQFSPEFLEELKQQHSVAYVEEDGLLHAVGQQASPPSWGLSRISQRDLDPKAPYKFDDAAGQGVDVYVVDTGVQAHKDFGGRAKLIKSFVTGESNSTDFNGHGTHCAGTIGSATYGVAKKASVFGVKVLNGQGSGTFSNVIAGIQYVAQRVRKGKTVMSMSLGGGKSKAVDDAVVAAIGKGVVAIVAAGNEASDACDSSPAGAPGVFTVGASNHTDEVADYSNYGSCVDLFAPGTDITSLWKGADGATETISGTSMATPHVAGVAALFMSTKAYTSVSAVYSDLKRYATKNKLTALPDEESPNALLFNSRSTL